MADNRIPAIDRALDVLDTLARQPAASISEISDALGIPRSTVYRILNSLEVRAIVVRDSDGGYHLGPQLLRLAGAVTRGVDIVALARPFMEKLAADQSVTVKLSVRDDTVALVVAVVESPKSYSITTQVGSRFPLHAGAASKVLLAHAGDTVQAHILGAPLSATTTETIVDPAAIRATLSIILRDGYAEDRGEYVSGVNAVAAPVYGPDGQCACAISVPYLSTVPKPESELLRDATIAAAKALTRQLGGYDGSQAPLTGKRL